MTGNRNVFPIVHGCALQRAVGEREAARLDDVDCDAKARRKPEICTQILGDVRLKECEAQFRRLR
jgi:hypothetical protein